MAENGRTGELSKVGIDEGLQGFGLQVSPT